MSLSSLATADHRHLWHPFTQMQDWCAAEPLILTEGEGAILRDEQGREYIDGNSSIWTNLHGHRHPVIDQAIRAQLEKVAHVSFLGTSNEPAIRLAEKLTKFFPAGTLERVFYSDDGSTAIEVAMKMALQYWQLAGRPEKKRFAAFEQAYHGDTAGASSLGGVNTFTARFQPIHFPIVQVADLAALDEAGAADLAAVVIEPLVQGAAGIRLWPDGMLKALRDWCDRNEVLLILDEVLTGFGRTGTMFACEQEGVTPDFLCLAKGLTGGYLPLAATLTTERIYAAFLGGYEERKTFFYGHSYCGNPLGCAAALASLEIFETEQTLTRLSTKVARLGEILRSLSDHSHITNARQRGFIAAVDIVRADGTAYPWQEQRGAKVCLAARKHGLLTRPILDTIVIMPPYCITDEQLVRLAEALRTGIDEVCAD